MKLRTVKILLIALIALVPLSSHRVWGASEKTTSDSDSDPFGFLKSLLGGLDSQEPTGGGMPTGPNEPQPTGPSSPTGGMPSGPSEPQPTGPSQPTGPGPEPTPTPGGPHITPWGITSSASSAPGSGLNPGDYLPGTPGLSPDATGARLKTAGNLLQQQGFPQSSPSERPSENQCNTDPNSDDGESVGQEEEESTDVVLPFFDVPFVFTRYYRSGVNVQTALGFGWGHSYNQHVREVTRSNCNPEHPDVIYQDARLSRIRFAFDSVNKDGSVVYRPQQPGMSLRLTKDPSHQQQPWTIDDGSGILLHFDDAYGDLVSITSLTGHRQDIFWSPVKAAQSFDNYQLEDTRYVDHVTDSSHRTVWFVNIPVNPPDSKVPYLYLQCLSLTEGDCSSPLVTFTPADPLISQSTTYVEETPRGKVTHYGPPVELLGFDLKKVKDANCIKDSACQGTTYDYDHDHDTTQDGTYSLTKGLDSFCHHLFDDKAQNCGSMDLCSVDRDIYIDGKCAEGGWFGDCVYHTWSDAGGGAGEPYTNALDMCSHPDTGSKDRCVADLKATAETLYPLGTYDPVTGTYPPGTCRGDLLSACLANKDANSKYAFGYLSALRHNLVKITDGDGRTVAQNTYGTDPFRPDFDKVITHVQGNVQGTPADATMTMEYHDIAAEGGGYLNSFKEIQICPDSQAHQEPAYVVAVHDINNTTRTSYFDASWNRLREVEEDGKNTDYNYQDGYLQGVQDVAGRRVCYQRDGFGRPVRVTEFPSTKYAPADPVVTEITYDDAGQVIEAVRDAGGPNPTGAHVIRDPYERVIAVGEAVNQTQTDWTCYQYSPYAPQESQLAVPTASAPAVEEVKSISNVTSNTAVEALAPAPKNMKAARANGFFATLMGRLGSVRTTAVSSIAPAKQDMGATVAKAPAVSGEKTSMALLPQGLQFKPSGCAQNLRHPPNQAGKTVDVEPSAVFTPDGAVRTQSLGPNGPQEIVADAYGADPRAIYLKYDGMGRLTEMGRGTLNKPLPGSSIQFIFDAAGQLVTTGGQDPNTGAWVPTTLGYDHSRNVISEARPELRRDIVVDELGHIQSVHESPQRATARTRNRSVLFPGELLGRLLNDIIPDAYGSDRQMIALRGAVSAPASQQNHGIAVEQQAAPTLLAAVLPIVQGRTTSFHYDIHGRLLDLTLPEGNTTHYDYDAAGRPAKMTRESETVATYDYDDGGLLRSSTVDGRTVSYIRDGFGRAVVTIILHDKIGKALETDNYVVRGFDSQGRVVWEAVSNHQPQSYAKPAGPDPSMSSMTEYSYDGLGRITSINRWKFRDGVSDADKYALTKIAYDSSANTVKTTDPEGKVTIVQADPLGRIMHESSASGTGDEIKTDYSYAPGDLVTVVSTLPQANQLLQYNAQGALKTATMKADGQTVLSQSYDPLGRLVGVQTEGLGPHTYGYDGFGQLAFEEQQTDANAKIRTSYSYDGNGRRVWIRDGANKTTRYQYDGLDRLVKETNGLGDTTYTYFPSTDLVQQMTDPAGTTRTYWYFKDGLPQSETIVDGAVATAGATTERRYDYTPLGQMKTATLAGGGANGKDMTVEISYDSLGRKLTEYNNALPIGISRAYRPGEITTSLMNGDPSQNVPLTEVTADYDNLYRTTTLKLRTAKQQQPFNIMTLQYQNGLLRTKTYGNLLTDALSYNGRGWPTGVQTMTAGNLPVAGVMDWLGTDDVPRARTRQFGPVSPKVDYFESDLAGRMTSENLLQAPQQQPSPNEAATNASVDSLMNRSTQYRNYALDGAANWLSRAGSDPLTPGTPDTANRYPTMDGNTLTYDKAGNLTNAAGESYAFNGLGQLVAASGANSTIKYTYDPLGRRISEDDGKTRNLFVWNGGEMVAYGPGDQDVSKMRAIVGDGGAPYALVDQLGSGRPWYLHAGTDGSTLAVTDDRGTFAEGYGYSGYGETTVWDATGHSANASAAGIDNHFLFQGQWFNPSTGDYTMGAREYKPTWGRWLSADPIGVAGGTNLYAFVDGRPLSFSDPSGLTPCGSASTSPSRWGPYRDGYRTYHGGKIDPGSLKQSSGWEAFKARLDNFYYRHIAPVPPKSRIDDALFGRSARSEYLRGLNSPSNNPEVAGLGDDKKTPWEDKAAAEVKKAKGVAEKAMALTMAPHLLARLAAASAYEPAAQLITQQIMREQGLTENSFVYRAQRAGTVQNGVAAPNSNSVAVVGDVYGPQAPNPLLPPEYQAELAAAGDSAAFVSPRVPASTLPRPGLNVAIDPAMARSYLRPGYELARIRLGDVPGLRIYPDFTSGSGALYITGEGGIPAQVIAP